MGQWSNRSWHSMALAAGFALALAGGVALSILSGDDPENGDGTSVQDQDVSGMSPDRRFAVLSGARSNRCDLGAAELRGMPDQMRLRGSCCFPMDRRRYGEQIRALRDYREIEQIPSDPYDVRVALAKRLLAYRDISLSAEQPALYRRAAERSDLGGPCCCRCWRWEAFRGQARYLIARRHYSAAQVARVWDTEEGCGGAAEHA